VSGSSIGSRGTRDGSGFRASSNRGPGRYWHGFEAPRALARHLQGDGVPGGACVGTHLKGTAIVGPKSAPRPPKGARMIASALSAACGFSILAIGRMSEPVTLTRRSTGWRSSARAASRSSPSSNFGFAPTEMRSACDRHVGRQAPVGARFRASGRRKRDVTGRAGICESSACFRAFRDF
jgi:hypothetical protein